MNSIDAHGDVQRAAVSSPRTASGPLAHEPRFDFGIGVASAEDQTSTIKELLAELNHEREKTDNSGSHYDIKNLSTVLRFVSSITGRQYRRKTEEHPLSTLRTIKLLHRASRHIDAHLIKLIEFPKGDSHGTLDFLTMPSSPEGEDVKRKIRDVITDLERGVDSTEAALIRLIADPAWGRGQYRSETNERVDEVLWESIHVDDELLKDADEYLANQTRQFLAAIQPVEREPRAQVATCVYLHLIEYIHWLHFELVTQLSIPNDHPISDIGVGMEDICASASEQYERDIQAGTNFLAIDEVGDFCERHVSQLAELVSSVVRSDYDNRALRQDIRRARLLLCIYLLEAKVPLQSFNRPIGIAHLAAAFASVLHQRNHKVALVKKSVKYGPRFSDPQRQLDQYVKGETRYIPYTTQHLYMARMKWYLWVLLGRRDKAESHRSYLLAQTELMREIFMSLSPAVISQYIDAYREWMLHAANDFVRAHGDDQFSYVPLVRY
ncbi:MULTISPECIES: hypothetical protein [Stenotrophomonas]|uniref:hypothetical protein n=1 Tax=Stenotrophomonas TaxID=40323 RepID=UPI001CF5DC22|nr:MULTISPECIES: hypothetical protein [Stenotrophomonas]MCA7024930.1 hypothetical protein [Stenotrophomonas acidaminiphila]MCE4074637.1 hypothetical protein [Stenotrophomonas acidaminiphila]